MRPPTDQFGIRDMDNCGAWESPRSQRRLKVAGGLECSIRGGGAGRDDLQDSPQCTSGGAKKNKLTNDLGHINLVLMLGKVGLMRRLIEIVQSAAQGFGWAGMCVAAFSWSSKKHRSVTTKILLPDSSSYVIRKT